MSNKNKIYVAGLVIYLVASLAGFVVNHYWLVLIASILVSIYVANIVFNKDGDSEVYESLKFDWISIFAFAGLELILTFCISLLALPLVGFLGYLNLAVQILGYLFVGYSVVRFALEYTNIINIVKDAITNRKNETIISEETHNEVASKVEEVIKEETKEEVVETIDVVEEVSEPEIISIELKKEEKEIATPYMEEEI